MSTSTIDAEVRSYIDSVATHLTDVPEHERRELLDDLHQHLLEVAAEGEGSLHERLGPPEEYARELRASAELSVERGRGEGRLTRALRLLRASRPARVLTGAWPELRPGWWLVRGYLAISMGSILADDGYSPYFTGRASIIDAVAPNVFGSRAAGVAAGILASWASLEIGRRSTGSNKFRRASTIASILTVLLLLGALNATLSVHAQFHGDDEVPTTYLHHPDGTAITNICPYTADGKLLSGVLLFDAEGRAIRNVADDSFEGMPLFVEVPEDSKGGRLVVRRVPSGPRTAVLDNAYPRPMHTIDPETGIARQLQCPQLQIPGVTPPAQNPERKPGANE